ncbi:MAG: EAL domain-containing protein [Rhodospirillales bacterium]|nr:EAL domain-containing protein [Alphaproteobacteria bacterium]USO04163.1 MAG: EAL domain-containing protein [Rhodospirillales bacterium]
MTTDWLNEDGKTVKKRRFFSARVLTSSSSHIWRSKISWRIALSVFLTILIVQVAILTLTLKQREIALLDKTRELGRTAIVSVMESNVSNLLENPIKQERVGRVLTSTLVKGIAVYSADLNLLGLFGEPVSMVMLDQDSLYQTNWSSDGKSYEVVYRPNDLRRPYVIVTRLNSENISKDILSYVQQTVLVMLLMSAFVTTVLMISLGRWLLEPVLFLRENLLAASENPEKPDIKDSTFDPADEVGGAIALAQNLIRQNADNLTRIKSAAEDKIHKLAYYDSLTGLPNRTLFLQKLSEQARQAGEEKTNRIAVIALDLDHFKDINDSMGHSIGDAILRGVGKRLRSAMPERAVVARSGEDEFAITSPLIPGGASAHEIAEKVGKVISSEPFKVFNEEFQVRASIGVATFPDDNIDPDQVLKDANIALNRAKEEGRDRIREYSEDFDQAVQQRFQLLRDLRDALENDELLLHYQPQFDLRTGALIGAEALLRWFKKDNSKEGGKFISPAEFVPIAEQSGLVVPIGAWVIKEACKTAAKWQKNGQKVRMAVNVSGAQFYQGDLVSHVSKVLQETGLAPENLEMEVTESVFMDDVNHTVKILQDLHSLGVELAIDDFGTGYSSLSYLRMFPIDHLKIDQSFTRNALNNPDDAAIAKTIISLGRSLNLRVIAEGVETKDHEDFLLHEGCDEVQGFRYSKAIPSEEFSSFIESYSGNLSYFDK